MAPSRLVAWTSAVVLEWMLFWVQRRRTGVDTCGLQHLIVVLYERASLAQMMGEDMAPGVKKGGYLNLTRRRLSCVGPAGKIPTAIEVDVSTLDFGQRIFVSGLSIPEGITVVDMVNFGHTAVPHWRCTIPLNGSHARAFIFSCL